MKTKHTPGPWHVLVENDEDVFTTRTIISDLYRSRNLSEVALCTTGSFCDDVEAANAKLIAAAPELLDALVIANEILNDDKIRSVIKKAIG
jgi:hypothetical protein